MKLEELRNSVRTGDWILPLDTKTFIGKWIKRLTFGKTNHIAIVYDIQSVFETDISYLKAKFHPLEGYANRHILLIRPRFLADFRLLQTLCKKYEGSPYSCWDIVTNAILTPFAPQIKTKLVELFGSKRFMICSELVSRIVYETTSYKLLADYEGMTPEGLRELAYLHPTDFEIREILA